MGDGGLAGARFDKAINGDTDFKVGNLAALPTLSADDKDTAANELRTEVNVAGESFSLGDLLGSGTSSKQGKTFVAVAHDKISALRANADLLIQALADDNRTLLATQLGRLWNSADNQIAKIFPGQNLDATRETNARDALDAFDEVLDALSSMTTFEAATREGGIFEDFLEGTNKTAEQVFDATMSESAAIFGQHGDTRFGAVTKKERENATAKLLHQLADDDGNGALGAGGAFAWATIDDTVRTHHIQTSGNAYYEGDTAAVAGDGTLYSGNIAIEVRFRTNKVSGLVTNLADTNGDAWVHSYGAVNSIILPQATLKPTANWSESKKMGGQATYAPRAGSPTATRADATFSGELLGTGDDAGSQAVGVWSFGTEPAAGTKPSASYIAGGFGAMRTEDVPGAGTGPVAGDEAQTKVIEAQGAAESILVNGKSRNVKLGAKLDNENFSMFGYKYDGAAKVTPNELETVQIPLATLLSKQGGTFWTNGPTQVALARAKIEDLRTRLGLWYELDDSTQIQSVWNEINSTLIDRLFDKGATKRSKMAVGQVVWNLIDVAGTKYNVDVLNTSATGGTLQVSTATGIEGTATYEAGTRLADSTSSALEVVVGAPDADGVRTLTRVYMNDHDSDDTTPLVATLDTDSTWTLNSKGLINVTTGDTDGATQGKRVRLAPVQTATMLSFLESSAPRTAAAALADVDAILDALASNGAFEDALADGGALENANHKTDEGTPTDLSDDQTVAVGDIWGRKEHRVQTQLGSTQFTRFGAWRRQVNNKAANLGYTSLNTNTKEDGPGAFAYSTLPQTVYANANDPSFPGGGSATYTGETVAVQKRDVLYGPDQREGYMGRGVGWNGPNPQGRLAHGRDRYVDQCKRRPIAVHRVEPGRRQRPQHNSDGAE